MPPPVFVTAGGSVWRPLSGEKSSLSKKQHSLTPYHLSQPRRMKTRSATMPSNGNLQISPYLPLVLSLTVGFIGLDGPGWEKE